MAAGGNKSMASSNSTVTAALDDGVKATGGAFTIQAGGTEYNLAQAISGSGGFVSVSASEAKTDSTNTTLATVGSGDAARNINVARLTIIADHTARFNGSADSSSGGVVDAPGANIENKVSTIVDAIIGKNAVIATQDLEVAANNRIRKDWMSDYNLIAASGGVRAFPAGASKTYIADTTQILVNDGASIMVNGNFGVPGNSR